MTSLTFALTALLWTQDAQGAPQIEEPQLDSPTTQPVRMKRPELERRIELSNGLTVIIRPVIGVKTAGMAVLYKLGDDHDPPGKSGMAHVIEHLYITAAAGNTPERKADDFFKAYDGQANAQTGLDYTVFGTVFPVERIEAELRDAAARMADLKPTETGLGVERPRVLNELDNMYGGIPKLGVLNLAHEKIRPSANNGRRSGAADHVRGMTIDELRERIAKYYKPNNAILTVTGSADVSKLEQVIRREFEAIPRGEPAPPPSTPGPPTLGVQVDLMAKFVVPGSTSHAAIGFPAPDHSSADFPAFCVGVWRLWKATMRQNQSDPTACIAAFLAIDDPTMLTVTTGIRQNEVPPEAYARARKFLDEAMTPKLRAIETINAANEMGFLFGAADIPDNLIAQNPYLMVFAMARREQRGLDPNALRRAIRDVKAADFERVIGETFSPQRQVSAAVLVMLKTPG
ncbi:MAG: hypothetical protein CHACPFDD_01115 [Phycisphaerae bacterium]|nr:hypothetical protein [Phycisphaerae bacterium]